MRRLFKYCMWHMDRLGRIWSAITKMKGSTNSAIIERQDILRFPVSITLLCIRVYIPFCQLIIIYHKLSQLLLICLQNIFEALKHSKVVCSMLQTGINSKSNAPFTFIILDYCAFFFFFRPEPSLHNSFRLALLTTLDWDVSPSYIFSDVLCIVYL